MFMKAIDFCICSIWSLNTTGQLIALHFISKGLYHLQIMTVKSLFQHLFLLLFFLSTLSMTSFKKRNNCCGIGTPYTNVFWDLSLN